MTVGPVAPAPERCAASSGIAPLAETADDGPIRVSLIDGSDCDDDFDPGSA
jgi:hypothetical protein